MDLVGEHAEAVWKLVKRTHSFARRSKLGVWISPPNGLMSLYPRSSATMMRKLGRFAMIWAHDSISEMSELSLSTSRHYADLEFICDPAVDIDLASVVNVGES